MHPGRCAAVIVDGQAIGHVGEFHPRWRQAYELPTAPIVFELDLAAVQARDVPQAAAAAAPAGRPPRPRAGGAGAACSTTR